MSQVKGLSKAGNVELNRQKYGGSYLAGLVDIDEETLVAEAARTPSLIAELGRLKASAFARKEEVSAGYRSWRDSIVFTVTNNLEEAKKAGFASVVSPGQDAKGKDKPPKLPPITQADAYLRTLPEYQDWHKQIREAEETWATIYSAYEAALARRFLISSMNTKNENLSGENLNRQRIVHTEPDRDVNCLFDGPTDCGLAASTESDDKKKPRRTSPPPVPVILKEG